MPFKIITIPFDNDKLCFMEEIINNFILNKKIKFYETKFFSQDNKSYWTIFIEFETILFIKENPGYPVPEGNPSYDWDKETRMPKSEKLNHPVVMISWHDARTYCNWLNSKLVNKELIPEGYEVRIPTEAEWEKAMHGGIIINNSVNSFPNRLFPWGNEPLKDHGNLPNIEPILSETTPVGVYPSGKSPYNILDMAGNAMEWVQTSWGSTDINRPGFDLLYNPNDGRNSNSVFGYRILRGGSWLFAESGAQCSCRLDENVRYSDIGMRIIVGPKLKS